MDGKPSRLYWFIMGILFCKCLCVPFQADGTRRAGQSPSDGAVLAPSDGGAP